MSRSYRKTPIFGFTNATSEKKDKQIWHRRMRHAEKQKLHGMPIVMYYPGPTDQELIDYMQDVFSDKCCPFCDALDVYDTAGDHHLTTLEKEACDIWAMSKDGKHYMSKESILSYIQWKSDYRGRNYGEGRVLHQLFAK